MPINLKSPTTRERLPIRPYSGHSSSAISFFQLENVYFALGRSSPWPTDEDGRDENDPDFIPPEPAPEAKDVDELLGMKRVSRKTLVIPDPSGDIVYRGSTWRSVSESEAIELSARWVLIEASFYYDELPVYQYRQVGIYSRTEKAASASPSGDVLQPNDIAKTGTLEVLDNRGVVTREADTKSVFQMIIEF